MNAKEFEDAIVFTIQEAQVKLGAERGAVSLYMPLDSIRGSDIAADSEDVLEGLAREVESRLGRVECSAEDGRVRITVPEEGCSYVASLPVSPVLKTMVESVREGSDSSGLRAKLNVLSEKCVWKDVRSKEFDHIAYFEDDTDPYVYCIKDEPGHITYHRLSRDDYRRLGFGITL